MEKLRAALEAQHQASVKQMREEEAAALQLQVETQVALANAAWKEEQRKVCNLSTAGFIAPSRSTRRFLLLRRRRSPGSEGWRRCGENSAERPPRQPVRRRSPRPAGGRGR